jgi:hypothetical protein
MTTMAHDELAKLPVSETLDDPLKAVILAHAPSCRLLFGVKPLAPVSFIATLVLSIVALFSIWMP